MSPSADSPPIIVSHLTLRRAVGAMGVLLPIVLAVGHIVLGGRGLQTSISSYYATNVGDVLVGTLFAIGWFLFAYRGYDRRDDLAGDLAWLFALLVALCPNSHPNGAVRTIHFAAAVSLFLVLSYFSGVLFTKSGGTPTPRKRARNRIYRGCAVVILVCISLAGVYSWLLADTGLARLNPVFWLESFSLWAFGLSWFVKGETLLKDG